MNDNSIKYQVFEKVNGDLLIKINTFSNEKIENLWIDFIEMTLKDSQSVVVTSEKSKKSVTFSPMKED